jgi:superfamily I DNA/RNA helicase
MDLESPEGLLGLPLLRVLSPYEWQSLGLPDAALRFAEAVSGDDYERDADGILAQLDELADYEKASLVLDLMAHAHAQEWPALHQRIKVVVDQAVVVPQDEVLPAMLSPDNVESFVTFDDSDEFNAFFDHHSLADWMLFLHPEQRKVSERDFKGPARLRGVSGSGKTSVLVHRARYLAKKYRQPILLVTFTESMRKLLDRLADDLCGLERTLLITATISSLARNVVHELHPQSSASYNLISNQQSEAVLSEIAIQLRANAGFSRSAFHGLDEDALRAFLRDEIAYVRSRLSSTDLDKYLDTKLFQRRGRGLALNETSRTVMLDAIRAYEARLAADHWLDYEGIVAEALRLIASSWRDYNRPRCILCDEVQDLSQLELALLAAIPTPDGEPLAKAENGLFLAGDGAQTIYRRGFTLRHLGIDITSRSFSLRKNYRNTYEILTAAFGLVSEYEFADVDEENIVKPDAPEFAKRRGTRPMLVRCNSLAEEAKMVVDAVKEKLTNGLTPGQLCIIGPGLKIREEVQNALLKSGIPHTDLRQDADYESDRVKVSTIESAKGHEFGSVFIVGLVEGIVPNLAAGDTDISREAARLYVAMTRARDTLTLSYSPTAGYSASRFLTAIQEHCDEAIVRNGQLRAIQPS